MYMFIKSSRSNSTDEKNQHDSSDLALTLDKDVKQPS